MSVGVGTGKDEGEDEGWLESVPVGLSVGDRLRVGGDEGDPVDGVEGLSDGRTVGAAEGDPVGDGVDGGLVGALLGDRFAAPPY